MRGYSKGSAFVMLILLAACSPAPVPTVTAGSVALPTSLAAPTPTSPAQPTPNAAPTVQLTFPEIAFSTNRDGNSEIYVMNADGSGQTNLTQNASYDAHPAWSPDGTRIAFTSDRDGNNEVYVMNADGSHPINLTQDPGQDDFPTWSPDGTQVAFSSERNQGAGGDLSVVNLYVVNADGSGQAVALFSYSVNPPIAWSPDGTQIAFSTNYYGVNGESYVMNADGSGQTHLTDLSGRPSWSPDGTRIALTKSTRAEPKDEIYVIGVDGSGLTNLTHNIADDKNPAWSPDGTQVAFNSDRDGNNEIYVMKADGSGQTNLTQNPGYDIWPVWSPK